MLSTGCDNAPILTDNRGVQPLFLKRRFIPPFATLAGLYCTAAETMIGRFDSIKLSIYVEQSLLYCPPRNIDLTPSFLLESPWSVLLHEFEPFAAENALIQPMLCPRKNFHASNLLLVAKSADVPSDECGDSATERRFLSSR